MASIVPAGVYGLRVPAGGQAIPATLDPSLALRITMAAIDPTAESEDSKSGRATLKLIRLQDDDDDEDDEDYDPDDVEAIKARLREEGVLGSDDDSDISEDDESDDEKNGGPSDPAKSKKAKREALEKKLQEDLDAEEMELDHLVNGVNGGAKGKGKAFDVDLSDSDDEEGGEVEELVLCTLDTDKYYQQPLEITVREGEVIYFTSTGSHDIYLSGNYVAIQDDSDDEEDDKYGMDAIDYDLSPDEDELDEDMSESESEDELDLLQDPRITEVDSDEEEAPKLVKADKKGKNKRPAESEDDDEGITLDELIGKAKADGPSANGEQKLSKKQAKKLKNNEGQAVAAAESAKKDKTESQSGDKKKVQFAKNLEQVSTGSPKVEEIKKEASKGPRTVNGVTIDDKKEGKGRAAKKGDRIEMRYIGKLKSNNKQFDANKKGKPFSFKLGVGEVIKGWDIGVVGMMAGSERRLTIPANLAYGKKGAPPDIPPNSDLIFDIKCISVN